MHLIAKATHTTSKSYNLDPVALPHAPSSPTDRTSLLIPERRRLVEILLLLAHPPLLRETCWAAALLTLARHVSLLLLLRLDSDLLLLALATLEEWEVELLAGDVLQIGQKVPGPSIEEG